MSRNSDPLESSFLAPIARRLGCEPRQVAAASALLADGATVPFIARYRKEATGGLRDEQLETLAQERQYYLELAARRDTVLESIATQDRLTPKLEAAIRGTLSKQELEDLYLPFKPKRRTRGRMARERGLEPLADALLRGAGDRSARPRQLAQPFVGGEVADADDALAGARDVLAERLAEDAEGRAGLRRALAGEGTLAVRVVKKRRAEAERYKDYFDHREVLARMPSHRLLAVLRGEREGLLRTSLEIDDDGWIRRLARGWEVPLGSPCGRQLAAATEDGYRRLLRPSVTREVLGEARERAEAEAIGVFRANLEALLMQAPLGQVPVMGVDPGLRTGAKVAVVDGTGRVRATAVIRPLAPHRQEDEAAATVTELVNRHRVQAVAVGNGTGGRETERFLRRALRDAAAAEDGAGGPLVAIVPETGASVYSASAVAREELPDLDVALRGAVSIARRLQDPLAELVKIDPRSLGIGQYQHDVDQNALARQLDRAVEGVVNRVGVELNTASPSLLERVSGLSPRLARTLVEHRDGAGPYLSREALLEVSGLGPRTFEQAAGFLRIDGAGNPLDRTAVHPERYPVVAAMARHLEVSVERLVGDSTLVERLDLERFTDPEAGLGRFTLEDIRRELLAPGRDPRPDFEAPEWRDDVESLEDLEAGMVLEGRVSNVTNFGAFVDLGIHRDGLVHVSELSRSWVDDPRSVVQVGQIVRVRVLEVDRQRGRVGLSMKQVAR